MSQFYDQASLVVVPSGYKAGTVYAQKPLTTDGQLAFTRTGDTATRVNSAGLLETVSANVPRLDYSGGATCPKLILEPQRTNRLTQSNNFTHADWASFASGTGSTAPVLTANYTNSPFGSNNAWRLEATIGSSGFSLLQQSPFVSGQHTASLWVKSNTGSNQSVYFRASTNTAPITVTPTWTRISVTEPNGDYLTIGLRDLAGQANVSIDISIYAGQLEDGAYPTSIIPTTTASATRGKDNCIKTSASALIGQTEGTVFVEFKINGQDLSEDVYSNNKNLTGSISIQTTVSGQLLAFICYDGTFIQFATSTGVIQIGQTYKVALAYKTGNSALYLNGVQIATSSTAFAFTTTLSEIDIANDTVLFAYLNNKNINQVLQFKTRLSNAELAQLTAL